MAKKGQFKARPGFERVPGKSRSYRDLRTGEIISKRQMVKRSEGYTSLEDKAAQLAEWRMNEGERQPMTRYNAIVRQYKITHPQAKVRGDSAAAREFKKLYNDFTKKQTAPDHTKRGQQQRERHLKAGMKLGIMTKQQYERYTTQ